MYSTRSELILGFHGCDESVALEALQNDKGLKASSNNYDWLGHGVYFWENSPDRALDFATFLKENPKQAKNGIRFGPRGLLGRRRIISECGF